MKLTSPEFENGKSIPRKFTCEGDDFNPRLIIEAIPAVAKSLALIVDDPDAPMGTWVHWVSFNIPVVSQINEDSIPGKQGINKEALEEAVEDHIVDKAELIGLYKKGSTF